MTAIADAIRRLLRWLAYSDGCGHDAWEHSDRRSAVALRRCTVCGDVQRLELDAGGWQSGEWHPVDASEWAANEEGFRS